MGKRQIRTLLEKLDLHPSRRLGQNFLVDPNLRDAIVRTAGAVPGERILEIGAGTGVLTGTLLERGCDVTAVEIDHRLAAYLRTRYGAHPRFRLVEADACDLDYDDLMGTEAYRCVANLPYSCASVILVRLAKQKNKPEQIVALLQWEMAERLGAEPGTKAYGALTVGLGLAYTCRTERRVPPQVFLPEPEVDSALIRLTRRNWEVSESQRRRAADLGRLSFNQRRKKALKVLASRYDRVTLENAFREAEIDVNSRPEEISPEQFLVLARRLA